MAICNTCTVVIASPAAAPHSHPIHRHSLLPPFQPRFHFLLCECFRMTSVTNRSHIDRKKPKRDRSFLKMDTGLQKGVTFQVTEYFVITNRRGKHIPGIDSKHLPSSLACPRPFLFLHRPIVFQGRL